MTFTSAAAFRRITVAGGISVVVALGAVVPAAAVDIVEGDSPVVLSGDQSTFGAIPEVFDADFEEGPPPEIDLLLFGGPDLPEITPWSTTAVSFDSEDRVFVALLTAGELIGEGEQYLCAIRVYDEEGVPLGGAMPVANPDDETFGAWPSPCTSLALLDVLSAYGLDFAYEGGIVEEAGVRTDALVYFANGDFARIDGRTGAVLDEVSGEGTPYGDFESLAISAGPAELLDPARSGIAVVIVGFLEDALIASVQYENGDVETELMFFPAAVKGAEFDSELNLWIVSTDIVEEEDFALSLTFEDVLSLGFGVTSNSDPIVGEIASAETLESVAAAREDSLQGGFESAAVSGGLLVSDLGSFEAGGIAIVRDAVELAGAAEEELVATGADDQLVLTIGVIAGALLIGGIVITAVGASRRRARRE